MPTPTTPGIYLRGGNKADFTGENDIKDREIVMATDTGEIGTVNGWFDPFTPIVMSGRTGNIYYEYDSTSRSYGNTWADGMVWTTRNFKGGSRVMLNWRCPFRNDSGGWGGGYIDIQYSLNGGDWISVGHSGYDGGVMMDNYAIGSMAGVVPFLNMPVEDFSLQIKFRHRSYDGTVRINGSHDISTGEFGAFWANVLFTEILP